MAAVSSCAASVSPAMIYFRPALFWQTVHPWHVADAGLEFRMNFTTQVNEARFPSGLGEIAEGRLAQMQREAERIVPDADGRDDAAALEKRLCDAATWGHADVVSDLLRTCYVTRAVAVPALVEAASKGNVDVVKVFVAADSRMAFALHAKYGKNALHAAAERGHEAVLSVLVECAKERADLYGIKEAARGMSVLQLLRANDMNGLARRIGTLAKRLFTPVRHVRSATLEDALDIFKLVNRAYSVEIGNEGLAFKTTDRFENIEEVHGMIEDFVLLVEEEAEEQGREKIVAVSGVVMHHNNHVGTFGPFAVDAREQKRGLGSLLLLETERKLRALGCAYVEIDVVNHRTDLFPFYSKHGYETSGEKKEMFAEDNHKVTASSVLTRPSHYVVLAKSL